MDSVTRAAMPRLTLADMSHLVCPVCYASLQLKPDAILCTGCDRRYPIVDGLPVLLAERAL